MAGQVVRFPICLRIFQFVVIHTVKVFGIVSKVEIDVFLELSCFFDDPCLRSGAAAERSNPTSKEQQLHGRRRAERSYSTFKVRRGGCEEIPLVQGKDQQLRFAGATVKRYLTSKVRETQVRP